MTQSRILVVDSDAEHTRACEALLRANGYEVAAVASAASGLETLESGSISAVLVDALGTGDVAALRASAAASRTPVFGMTELWFGPTNARLSRSSYGERALLQKPLDASALTALRGVVPETRGPASGPVGTPISQSLHTREARPASGPLARPVQLLVPPSIDVALVGTEGDLAEAGFATVLSRFALSGATGTLSVDGGARVQVFFAAGRVVGAVSADPAQSFAAILAGDGVLRDDQVDAVARNLGPASLDDGAALVDAGLLSPDALASARSIVVRRRLLELFARPSGAWFFEAGEPPRSARVELDRSPIEIIWEGARNVLAPASIREALQDMMSHAPAWVTQPPSGRDIELTRWQRAIVGSIDGETSTSELLIGVPDRDGALALVFTLVVGGYVGFAS